VEDEDRRIVNDLLGQFVTRLRQRDVDGALRLFSDDPVLFGSEAEETVHGVAELEAFFRRLFERSQTYGWTWEQPTARKAGGVVWFVARATVVVHGDDGSEQSAPYRLSGVLEPAANGRWRFSFFNGAEPVPHQLG
jgi:ketosteroid isomerase-like protein